MHCVAFHVYSIFTGDSLFLLNFYFVIVLLILRVPWIISLLMLCYKVAYYFCVFCCLSFNFGVFLAINLSFFPFKKNLP